MYCQSFVTLFIFLGLCHGAEELFPEEHTCPAEFAQCQSDASKGSAMIQNKKLLTNTVSGVVEMDPHNVNQAKISRVTAAKDQHPVEIGDPPKPQPVLEVAFSELYKGTPVPKPPAWNPEKMLAALNVSVGETAASVGDTTAADKGTPANATHNSSSIDLQESSSEKLRKTILDIMAVAKKDGVAIPPPALAILKKILSGGNITAKDVQAIEDVAATTPEFEEMFTAEMANLSGALTTAHDFATWNGVAGEDLGPEDTDLPAFQGDMIPASKEQLLLFQSLYNQSIIHAAHAALAHHATHGHHTLSPREEDEDDDEDEEEEDADLDDQTMGMLEEDEHPTTRRRRRAARRRRTSSAAATRRRRGARRRRTYTGPLSAGDRWTKGKVNYCYASDINPAVKHIFEASVKQYNRATSGCLSFVDVGLKRGSSTSSESYQECRVSPAIFVMSAHKGCYSYVGMVPSKKSQQLNLAPAGCVSIGISIHELGHALGMAHEHSRPDRDKFVTVDFSNVPSNKKHNFDKAPKGFTGEKYDLLSIMHYDAFAFAVNPKKPSILQNDKSSTVEIGQRTGLSRYDIKQLEWMYKPEQSKCKGATGLSSEKGCINKLDDNGKDVCSGLTKCSSNTVEFCCGCGGGLEVLCYKDQPCPKTPALPPPADDQCILDKTAAYKHAYPCVFANGCAHAVKLKCPSGCSYVISEGKNKPRVQQCDGGVDTGICQGKCQVSKA